jgi:hypothetical protein
MSLEAAKTNSDLTARLAQMLEQAQFVIGENHA